MFQKAKKKMGNEKGFTLVELLVVLAVMGIIAAIAFPTFSGMLEGFRYRGDEATADAIARQIEARLTTGVMTNAPLAAGYTVNAGDTVAATADAGLWFGEAWPPARSTDLSAGSTATWRASYIVTAVANADDTAVITVYYDRNGDGTLDAEDPSYVTPANNLVTIFGQ